MDYQKKAQALIRQQIREAGRQKTFEINGRNMNLLTMLQKMAESGQIVEVVDMGKIRSMSADGTSTLYTYRLVGK